MARESNATGRKKRPAFLFIPGWMTPAWIWEHQVAHFARDYHVVAMDPRSQGDSSKPADGHHPAVRARDIKALVDRLKLAPVVLVASSISVMDVASYVGQFGTDTVAGLVLVNGIAGREYDLDDDARPARIRQLFSDGPSERRRTLRAWHVQETAERGLHQKDDSGNAANANRLSPGVFLGSLASDNRSALAKIDKPTLIVVARVNAWMPFYEDLRQRIRGSQMEVFENAGHALFVDEAAQFNSMLEKFVGSLVAAQPVQAYNPRVVMTSLSPGDPQRGMDIRTSNMDRVS